MRLNEVLDGEEAMSETSQRWAQFRFAVVGHLVFSGIEKGKLAPQLISLSQEMETPDLRKVHNSGFFNDRALVLHRPEQSHRPNMCAEQEALRCRGAAEPH